MNMRPSSRVKLLLLIMALLMLYLLSFGLVGQYGHVTWNIPYTVRDAYGRVYWTQDFPPGTAPLVFWFSKDRNWNRRLYYFYWPLARSLKSSSYWMFLQEVPAEFDGEVLLRGIIRWKLKMWRMSEGSRPVDQFSRRSPAFAEASDFVKATSDRTAGYYGEVGGVDGREQH